MKTASGVFTESVFSSSGDQIGTTVTLDGDDIFQIESQYGKDINDDSVVGAKIQSELYNRDGDIRTQDASGNIQTQYDGSGSIIDYNDGRYVYQTDKGLIITKNQLEFGTYTSYDYSQWDPTTNNYAQETKDRDLGGMGSSSTSGSYADANDPNVILIDPGTFALPDGSKIISAKRCADDVDASGVGTYTWNLIVEDSSGVFTESVFSSSGDQIGTTVTLDGDDIFQIESQYGKDINDDSVVGAKIQSELYNRNGDVRTLDASGNIQTQYDGSGSIIDYNDGRYVYQTDKGLIITKNQFEFGTYKLRLFPVGSHNQ